MPKHPRRVFYAPATFAEDIHRLDLRIKDVARVLAVSESSAKKYKSGQRRIPLYAAQKWQQYLQRQGA